MADDLLKPIRKIQKFLFLFMLLFGLALISFGLYFMMIHPIEPIGFTLVILGLPLYGYGCELIGEIRCLSKKK